MMENLWPEKSWTHDEIIAGFPSAKNLGDIIAATEVMAKQENVVVCEVRANGMRLSEEQEILYRDTPLLDLKSFSVRVQKIDSLLDESLAGCGGYLQKLSESLEVAATLFREEDLIAAHKYYKSCTEGTELFIEMITHYKIVFQKARGKLTFDWKQHEDRLLEVLGQVLDAYKKKNYILVADLLEYDLINVLNIWREEILKLEQTHHRDTGPIPEVQT